MYRGTVKLPKTFKLDIHGFLPVCVDETQPYL
jgi:hypothetical protein